MTTSHFRYQKTTHLILQSHRDLEAGGKTRLIKFIDEAVVNQATEIYDQISAIKKASENKIK